MGVVRACTRIAAVLALRGATWADTRVYDSRNTPIDEAMETGDKPWITVFTDTDKRTITGRDMAGANRDLALVIEMGIAGPVAPDVAGSGPVVAIPSTDAAYERAIDMMEAQAMRALFHDPSNAWGEIFRKLVIEVKTADANRAGQTERGARWAARSVSLTLDTIADPLPAVPLSDDHPLKEWLAAARASTIPGLPEIAALFEAEIVGTPAPPWQQAQAILGLTEAGVRGIGLAPPYATPATEAETVKIGLTPGGDRATEGNVGAVLNVIDLTDGVLTIPASTENPV